MSLAEAGSGKTDWSRLQGLTDAELDEAIAADPDTFALSDSELRNAEKRMLSDRALRFEVRKNNAGEYIPHLVDQSGRVILYGAAFPSKSAALAMVKLIRQAFRESQISA
jgi:uncharacterized protein YegP (UPF0339 family)